jgi:hypothetical protein
VLQIRIHWFRIWIRIKHSRLNTNRDPGLGWTKIGKNLQLKKCNMFFIKKMQFTVLIHRPH